MEPTKTTTTTTPSPSHTDTFIMFKSPIRRGGYTQQRATIRPEDPYHLTKSLNAGTGGALALCNRVKICSILNSEYFIVDYDAIVRCEIGNPHQQVICKLCLKQLVKSNISRTLNSVSKLVAEELGETVG